MISSHLLYQDHPRRPGQAHLPHQTDGHRDDPVSGSKDLGDQRQGDRVPTETVPSGVEEERGDGDVVTGDSRSTGFLGPNTGQL